MVGPVTGNVYIAGHDKDYNCSLYVFSREGTIFLDVFCLIFFFFLFIYLF
jgi:hypothetical protein